MHRYALSLSLTCALVLAMLTGCQERPPAPPPPAATPDAVAAEELPPVEPPPPCELPKESADRPRGKVIALFHTSNVVGELDPCG